MGTKIDFAINPLATTSTNSNSFDVHRVDDWDYFQTRELKKFRRTRQDDFRDSMDRMLEKHNIDSIKRTMQIHEDIFKHQVQELHRLYSVQKMLMDELKKEIKQNRNSSTSMASSDINHSHQFMKRHYSTAQNTSTSGYIFHVQSVPEDPSSRERSGSCSGETMRMPIKSFDLERPAVEDMSTGISGHMGNKMSVDGSDEDSEVELTLGIGVNSGKKRSKGHLQPLHSQEFGCSESIRKENRELDSSASFKSDRGEDCSCPNTPMSSSSATFDQQEKKMPHWLFGLSINRS